METLKVDNGNDDPVLEYLNLNKNVRKDSFLRDNYEAIEKIKSENEQLLQEREVNERDSYLITEFLRNEIMQKNKIISELEQRIIQIDDENKNNIMSIQDEAELQKDSLMQEYEKEKIKLNSEILNLKSNLNSVNEYFIEKEEVNNNLKCLKKEKEELKMELNKTKNDLERNFVEEISQLKQDFESRIETEKKKISVHLDDYLDKRAKEVQLENYRLTIELDIHIKELDDLYNDYEKLKRERDTLRRDIEIKSELEVGYAKRSVQQNQLIKDYKTKVRVLENSLEDILDISKKDKRENIKIELLKNEELKMEIEGLKKLVQFKIREEKEVNRYLQEVLKQRNNIESFLISSLSMVRREIKQNDLNLERDLKLDDIKNDNDIDNMCWEDREKVLKLLFSKINALPLKISNEKEKLIGEESREGLANLT